MISIYIPWASYQKIMGYAQVCDTEITGFADLDYDPVLEGLVVGEVYLVNQEASDAHVEIDEDTVHNFLGQLMQQGLTQMPRLWWHSHVEMATFMSTIDEASLAQLENDSFMVALVVNKRRESYAKLTCWQPFPFSQENVEVVIQYPEAESLEQLKAEVAQKVKTKVITSKLPASTKAYLQLDLPEDKQVAP